jgi:regulator of protease activity HflC (stomatin/prohibitin superfamily)
MSKLIVNVENGETVERDLNAKELAQQATDEANIAAEKAIHQAEADAKATAKAALLDRLGITAEEAVLLLS